MIRMLCFGALLALGVCGASADEYWIAYEGNDWPENVGWTRGTSGGGAIRFLERGNLVIDSRASIRISDFYSMDLGGSLDPDPGEIFVARWRILIEEVNGLRDPAFEIRSDDRWALVLYFDEATVGSLFEPGIRASFEPGVYHRFEVRSSDMRRYELYIDESLAITGAFRQGLFQSQVSWGDGFQGSASLTRWDYLRFGVVPEPSTAFMAAFALLSRRATA